MIKYAERGLVSNGPNIELYNKLFWVNTSIFLLLYHSIMTAMNLRGDSERVRKENFQFLKPSKVEISS